MPPRQPDRVVSRAERQFREAFDRLKAGRPQNIPKGKKLSLASVAQEAGLVRSALKRSRFPELYSEIEQWVEAHKDDPDQGTPYKRSLVARAANRDLRKRNEEMRKQRDHAVAQVVILAERVLELTIENQRYRAQLELDNVKPLVRSGPRRE